MKNKQLHGQTFEPTEPNSVPQLLHFTHGNAKAGKDVWSFSLPAGWTCPGANECWSRADRRTGKITDGPDCRFRCFAAQQEAGPSNVRFSRWNNYDLLRRAGTAEAMADLILRSLTPSATKIRIHVGGDFWSIQYLEAWAIATAARPQDLFWGYTKSIPFWVALLGRIPSNLVLTASLGGKFDSLVEQYNLRYAKVVFHPSDTTLPIDHNDSLAQDPNVNAFALLLHSVQPKDSPAAKALQRMRREQIPFSYSRTAKGAV